MGYLSIHDTEQSMQWTDDQKKLRKLLKEVRKEADLTQVELSLRLQKPQSYVSKYESGERRLDVLELRLVCEAIGITLGDFVSRLESME